MPTDPRYTLIAQTLRERGYHCSAVHPGIVDTLVQSFEVWVAPALGRVRIVQVFREGEGYEVFGPVGDPQSNKLQDTLDAI